MEFKLANRKLRLVKTLFSPVTPEGEQRARVFLESVGSAVNTPISTDKGFEYFVIFSLEILESGFSRRKAESKEYRAEVTVM